MLCNHQANDVLEQPLSWEEKVWLVLRRSLISSWKRLLSQIITSRRDLKTVFSKSSVPAEVSCSKISLTSILLGKMECFLSSVLCWYLKSEPKHLTMNNFVVISQSVKTFTYIKGSCSEWEYLDVFLHNRFMPHCNWIFTVHENRLETGFG